MYKRRRRLCERVKEDVLLRVAVLVDEAVDVVDDGAGVVPDSEFRIPASPVLTLDVVRVGLELGVDVGQVSGIAALESH